MKRSYHVLLTAAERESDDLYPPGRAYQDGKLLEEGWSSQSIHSVLWLLTGEGDPEEVNYSRKDCVMLILAMEARARYEPSRRFHNINGESTY